MVGERNQEESNFEEGEGETWRTDSDLVYDGIELGLGLVSCGEDGTFVT